MEKLIEFHAVAGDFLELIASKGNRNNKAANDEATIMEAFYTNTKQIIERLDKERHALAITGVNDRMKAKIMESELHMVYSDLIKNNYDMIELMKSSSSLESVRAMEPSQLQGRKQEMRPDQVPKAKEKYNSGIVTLNEIYGAFHVPENLVREFIKEKDG